MPLLVCTRAGSANRAKLSQLLHDYRDVVRGIREVNPQAEEQRSSYDMESLAEASGVDEDR